MWLLKKILKVLAYGVLIIALFIIGCNIWIYFSTADQVFTEMSTVTPSQVALVLGTSNRLVDGSPNPFFKERMQTAAELYHSGKVKHILVSGDNATRYYNEPEKMRRALVALGVPQEDITLDYAGFRTLDSIVRCKKIFGQENVIIITQPFHSYRALFISNYYDMNAVAMTTDVVDESLKVHIREYFARTLAVWDLYIIKKGPKFLGKKETLDI